MAAALFLFLAVLFILLEIANVRGTLHDTLRALVAKG